MLNHYSRHKGKSNNTVILHDGQITASPVLAIGLGGPGTLVGLFSNCWQVYTTQLGFLDMITERAGLFGFLNIMTTTARLNTSSPIVTASNWLLAIAVQFGMIFFALRVKREIGHQYPAAQGSNKVARGVNATKAAAVTILHNRDLMFYYGMGSFALDGLGDYAFVTTFTGSVVYMFCYGLIIMMTSTIILAYAAEWFWVGIDAFINAVAQAKVHARPKDA